VDQKTTTEVDCMQRRTAAASHRGSLPERTPTLMSMKAVEEFRGLTEIKNVHLI